MYNIKKAVSRLDFAPKIDEIKITEIKRGLGAFAPKPDKPVSFAALRATLKKAGYTLASAEITVVGTLARDDAGLRIEADLSNQQFAIEGDNVKQILGGADAGAHVEITGDWQTIEKDATSREVIRPRAARKVTASWESELHRYARDLNWERSLFQAACLS